MFAKPVDVGNREKLNIFILYLNRNNIIMKKYQYTRQNHFLQKLKSLEGQNEIPENIYELVENGLNGKTPSRENIRIILKNNKLKIYYEDIPSIIRELNSRDANIIHTNAECPVCMCDVEQMREMKCKHSFCLNCVNKIIDCDGIFKCPLCRAKFSENVITIIPKITDEQTKMMLEKFERFLYIESQLHPSQQIYRSYEELVREIAQKCDIIL